MKFSKNLILTLSLLGSGTAWAVCPPPAGPLSPPIPPMTMEKTESKVSFFKTKHYWKTCYSTVSVHGFGGEAMKDLDDLKLTFQEKYHVPLLSQLTEASEQKLAIIAGSYQALTQTLSENYSAVLEAQSKMKLEMLEMELDYVRSVQEKKMNEKNQGMFNDDNGKGGLVRADTQSFQYYKSVCKRNKMFAKTASPIYQEKRNMAVNKAITEKSVEMTKVTGDTNSIALSTTISHNSNYCSTEELKYEVCTNPDLKLCIEGDEDSGICLISTGEIFELTNKDTDAVNLLTPSGFNGSFDINGNELEPARNKIEDELFNVKETYDENQLKAAEDFASNLIFQPGVKAPTNGDKENFSKKPFVNEYNRYLANLNLANYSFQNAIIARKPITEGEIKMSEKDIMRYVIHNLKDPDTNAATMASKDKGRELMIFQLLSVNNKLRLDNLGQKNRIESLLATMVANGANSPSELKALNSLK